MKRSKKNTNNNKSLVLSVLLLIAIIFGNYFKDDIEMLLLNITRATEVKSYSIEEIPDYEGSPYVLINEGIPSFTEEEKNLKELEIYGDLDILGRCTYAFALVGPETMPTTERTSIGNIKPTGWHTIKYDNVDGKYLYNRCHLIGYQLTGENANPNNLITCTRQMNTKSMLDFENEVSDYIKNTNNHVLYKVTPIFKDNELVARGVQIEALSIEDNGKGIKLNVFIYNVQDNIKIDYKTGESTQEN